MGNFTIPTRETVATT